MDRTLDQHCKPDGCRLYFTKKGTTPIEYQGLLDAVFVCRARQKAGLDLANYPLPHWAEKAYLVGNSVFTQAENESNEDEDDAGNTQAYRIQGAGDSGTFALIHEHLRETGERIRDE